MIKQENLTEKTELSFNEMMQLVEKIKNWDYYEDKNKEVKDYTGRVCRGEGKGYKGEYNGIGVDLGVLTQRGFRHVMMPTPDTRKTYFITVSYNETPAGHFIMPKLLFTSFIPELKKLQKLYSSLESERMSKMMKDVRGLVEIK